jgi:hypothetical protein
MPILTRNVTGSDLFAIRKTISDRAPITNDKLVELYFPGNASDPQTSDQRKPLQDAIEFLVEINQIRQSNTGYELTETAAKFDDTRLGLLHGIRTADGQESAYNDVLECLAEQSDVLADRSGELIDEMSNRVPAANWNEQKLRYWARVMEEIGVTKEVYGGETTTMFGPTRSLALRMLVDVTGDNTAPLATVLADIDEEYLPVIGDGMEIATYFERTLLSLQEKDDVRLRTVSDIGQSVDIDGTGYSAIEVMSNE